MRDRTPLLSGYTRMAATSDGLAATCADNKKSSYHNGGVYVHACKRYLAQGHCRHCGGSRRVGQEGELSKELAHVPSHDLTARLWTTATHQ
jgi:hypothetical protein